MIKLKRRTWVAIAAGATVVALASGVAVASAATTGPKPVSLYACEGSGHVSVTMLSSPSAKCPAGTTSVVVGAQGPRGPQGPAGTSYQPVTANAIFNLTGRPDSGGNGNWASDNITRDVTVTRHGAVPASDCGSGATQCWFYTATVGDTGTFTTISGAYTPNQGGSAAGKTISGIVTGSLTGGGDQEFYADQAAPVTPTKTAYTGSAPTDTSDWYKLFFPSTANYGLAPATSAGQPWTSWSWSYDAPKTCETWTDSFADSDGQGTGAGQGNITGVNACTS